MDIPLQTLHNFLTIYSFLQFIREYTGKVDELVKDKFEALNEVKAKEKEEKDVIAQQVQILGFLGFCCQLFAIFIFNQHCWFYVSIVNQCEMWYLQNMYAQLLPLALPAPPGMGGGSMGGGFAPPPMGGMGMPPMPPYGMPPMGSSY